MQNRISKRRAVIVLAAAGAMVTTGLGVSGASTIPSHSKKVTVKADANHKKISGTLPASGAITGKVSSGGKAVSDVQVAAYDSKGNEVAYDFVASDGKFSLYGLDNGKYRVCETAPVSGSPSFKYGVAAGCIGSSQSPTYFGIPKDAKKISVHRGHATKANLSLPKAGAISGVVKSSSGKKLDSVVVDAYQGQQAVRGAQTDSHGAYSLDALRPGKYKICFFPENNEGSTTATATGVLRQCYKNVAYPGTKMPSSAKSVTVKANKNTGKINASMRKAGAISGTVTSTKHKALNGSQVEVFRGKTYYTATSTNDKGKYTLKDLPTGNYTVCAVGGVESDNKTAASAGRCYVDKPFKNFKPSAGSKSVSAKVGKTHKHINLKLPTRKFVYGAISGKLTGPGGVGIGGAQVYANGAQTSGSATTASDGTYTINNLLDGNYTVCFDPLSSAAPSSGTAPQYGYSKVCYKSAAWGGGSTGVPSGAKKVAVKGTKTTEHVNAQVGKGGAISGTVKLAGGDPGFVVVQVLNAKGAQAAGGEYEGSYTATAITPASYFVCFSPLEVNFDPPNKLGYIGQCYKNQTWHDSPTGGFGLVRGRTGADVPFNRYTAQQQIRR